MISLFLSDTLSEITHHVPVLPVLADHHLAHRRTADRSGLLPDYLGVVAAGPGAVARPAREPLLRELDLRVPHLDCLRWGGRVRPGKTQLRQTTTRACGATSVPPPPGYPDDGHLWTHNLALPPTSGY